MLLHMFLAGMIMITQPMERPDSLTITQQEDTIAVIDREEFTIHITDTPLLDIDKYKRLLDKLDREIHLDPINAKIGDWGEIEPGKPGYRLDRKRFHVQFYQYFIGRGASKIEVPRMEIYPEVDSELLANIRVKQIGQYVTYFNSRNENRTQNIMLAAEAIDNHVIFPGEVFSFNEVVGKRSEEKGYMPAPIIIRGELSEGVGGGICQVSTTLFNAVEQAGLKIVERYSHSKKVPYVPPGRDATVDWYGADFRFQNRYNQPILIRAKRYGGSMIVKLYSSEVINYEPK